MKVFGQKPSPAFVVAAVVIVLLWLSVYIPNILPARTHAAKQYSPPTK